MYVFDDRAEGTEGRFSFPMPPVLTTYALTYRLDPYVPSRTGRSCVLVAGDEDHATYWLEPDTASTAIAIAAPCISTMRDASALRPEKATGRRHAAIAAGSAMARKRVSRPHRGPKAGPAASVLVCAGGATSPCAQGEKPCTTQARPGSLPVGGFARQAT